MTRCISGDRGSGWNSSTLHQCPGLQEEQGLPDRQGRGLLGWGSGGQQRQPVTLSGSKTRSTLGNQEMTSLVSSHPRWLLLALHGDFCTPSPMVGLMSGALGLKWSCWGSLISHPGNLSCCSRGAQRTEQMLVNPSWLYT